MRALVDGFGYDDKHRRLAEAVATLEERAARLEGKARARRIQRPTLTVIRGKAGDGA